MKELAHTYEFPHLNMMLVLVKGRFGFSDSAILWLGNRSAGTLEGPQNNFLLQKDQNDRNGDSRGEKNLNEKLERTNWLVLRKAGFFALFKYLMASIDCSFS